jgi:hypothetical protein
MSRSARRRSSPDRAERRDVSISDPIQDVFNGNIGTDCAGLRVVELVTARPGRSGVVYAGSMAKLATQNQFFALDAATGDILWQYPALSSVNAGPAIVNGTVYEWLGPNNTEGAAGAFLQTMPLSGDRKSRHRLQEVRLYVSDVPDEPWTVEVSVNELAPSTRPAILYPDPLFTIQPPGSLPLDAPDARELMMIPAADPTAQLDGYRFWVKVNYPDNAEIQEVYAMDIVLTDLEPPDETGI